MLAVIVSELVRNRTNPGYCINLVPSARLELAQLSPLPPQDSVSTNFTTTACRSNQTKFYFEIRGLRRCNKQLTSEFVGKLVLLRVRSARVRLEQRILPRLLPEPALEYRLARESCPRSLSWHPALT